MKKLFFIFAFSFACFLAFSQETSSAADKKIITIDEAVTLASSNNVSLKRQKLSLDLLEKKDKYSWNSVSPSLSASANASLPFDTPSNWSVSLSGSVNLRFTPSLFTSIKAAQMDYENGLTSYDAAVKAIELNVRKLFYNLILSKENIAQQNRSFESAKQRYTLNKERYSRGQLSEIDLLTSQYNYEQLIPTIETLQNSYENSIASFKKLLGIPQDQEIELAGSFEDFASLKEIEVSYDVNKLSSVKSIQTKIASAENSLQATKYSAWGPSVSLGYSYGYGWRHHNADAPYGSAGVDGSKSGNSLSLGVSIPLDGYLPWSNGALSIEAQEINLRQLKIDLEEEKLNANLNIQNSLKQINQAKNQLALLESNITLAQKTYELTLNAYNHGSKDLLSLQSASDSIMTAKNKYYSQLYTLISSILDLENTLGLPFGSLLNE